MLQGKRKIKSNLLWCTVSLFFTTILFNKSPPPPRQIPHDSKIGDISHWSLSQSFFILWSSLHSLTSLKNRWPYGVIIMAVNWYYEGTIHTGCVWDQDWTPKSHRNIIKTHRLKQSQDLTNGYITLSSLFLFRSLSLFRGSVNGST